MEKYMGLPLGAAGRKAFAEGRQLPTFDIGGTEFIVDIARQEFRQKTDPYNRIIMTDVKELTVFSILPYDPQTQNRHVGEGAGGNLPPHVQLVIVPPLKDLDPVGLARIHGFADDYYHSGMRRENALTTLQREDNAKHQKHERAESKPGRKHKLGI